jgi:hypothetical protein
MPKISGTGRVSDRSSAPMATKPGRHTVRPSRAPFARGSAIGIENAMQYSATLDYIVSAQ